MDHLKDDFDPSSLTSAQLRNILNRHEVKYSSSATKSSLIEVFNSEIAPNAKKLLKEYNEKVKNSNDEGFVNASEEPKVSSTTNKKKTKSKKSTPEVESDDKKEPTLEVTKTRAKKPVSKLKASTSRRTSSRTKSPEISDTDEETGSVRATRNRSNGNSELNSLFDLDDSVLQVRKTSGKAKTTKSKTTKSVEAPKEEEEEESLFVKEEKTPSPEQKKETSFSKENVFQSPSPSASASSSAKKRKHPEDEKESSVRKRTISSAKKSKHSETPSSVKKSHVKKKEEEGDDSDTELYEKFLKQEETTKDDSSSTIITPSKQKSVKSRSSSSKISKPKSKSSSRKSTPSKISVSSPTSSKDESFKSAEEDTSMEKSFRQVDPDMAKSLGITIQGFQPPVITTPLKEELARKRQPAQDASTPMKDSKKVITPRKSSSKVSTPKHSKDNVTPISSRKSVSSSAKKSSVNSSKKSTPQKQSPLFRKSALTPKPRLLSLGSQKYETDSDEDDEDEDNSEVNLSKTSEAETSYIASHKGSISFSKFLGSMILWILVVGSGLFGLWYYEQKYSVGYCGQEIDQLTFSDSNNIYLESIGKFLDDNFKPNCISCPKYSRCHPNLKLSCMENFMESKPWYDFIVPGHKKCIPDTKKAEKLEIMIDVALDLLRSKNAAIQCGLGTDDEECGIKLEDLHDLLLSIKAPYITLEEFEELWEKSVIELEKEPDIVIRQVR
ncbi:Inner nuclear membrane protein SRC1 [Candida tropicalis]